MLKNINVITTRLWKVKCDCKTFCNKFLKPRVLFGMRFMIFWF